MQRAHAVHTKTSRGFTLIETVIGSAIFAIIALSVWMGLVNIFEAVTILRTKTVAANLATEQIEIIRNLPYNDVGILNGLPAGVIPYEQTLVRDNKTFFVRTTIRNIDLPFDGTIDSDPPDLNPVDNKLVEVYVACLDCAKEIDPIVITTQVAPKSLEDMGDNGALFISVFDANGQPVAGAQVQVTYLLSEPPIVVQDMTNINGMLQIIGAPAGVEAYEIFVTKDGYSSERTYPIDDEDNPSPYKPHANVVSGQVTQISFAIDRVSTLTVNTRTITCAPISGITFNLESSKMIGVETHKYDEIHVTNTSGQRVVEHLEWDTYNLTLLESNRHLIGSNPNLSFDVYAGTQQSIDLILGDSNPNAVLVTVIDGANQQLLSDATVKFTQGASMKMATTGSGYLEQTDWSKGAGQVMIGDETRYFAQSGTIETNTPAGELSLVQFAGEYVTSGWLESSVFDVGTTTNFLTLSWTPSDQPQLAGQNAARFQLATNETLEEPVSWNFFGPNSSSGSYYTSPGQSIAGTHQGDRYVKYRVFLETANQSVTPNISDVRFSFATDCTPVGQAYVDTLNSNPYTVSISKPGYQTATLSDVVFNQSWQTIQITLNPN